MSIAAIGLISLFLGMPIAVVDGGQCPECDYAVEDHWNYCPIDGTELRNICPKCESVWAMDFKFCPKDSSPLGRDRGERSPKKDKEEDRPIPNTPASVVDEFIDALRSRDAKQLDGLIHWESYYRTYLAEEKVDEKDLSLEKFRTMVHDQFLTEKVQDRVRRMVKNNQDGNTFTINGNTARLTVTLVNPKDSKDRMSNTFVITILTGRWLITQIA